jgi:hypothetical protein
MKPTVRTRIEKLLTKYVRSATVTPQATIAAEIAINSAVDRVLKNSKIKS